MRVPQRGQNTMSPPMGDPQAAQADRADCLGTSVDAPRLDVDEPGGGAALAPPSPGPVAATDTLSAAT